MQLFILATSVYDDDEIDVTVHASHADAIAALRGEFLAGEPNIPDEDVLDRVAGSADFKASIIRHSV